MLTVPELLQLYTIVKETKAILPGRARLLAALDRAIDTYPRTTTEER